MLILLEQLYLNNYNRLLISRCFVNSIKTKKVQAMEQKSSRNHGLCDTVSIHTLLEKGILVEVWCTWRSIVHHALCHSSGKMWFVYGYSNHILCIIYLSLSPSPPPKHSSTLLSWPFPPMISSFTISLAACFPSEKKNKIPSPRRRNGN